MAIPKIALIPSGVKAGKLYSVLPTDGAGDFTTTRASVATRVNENGLIEEVASNVPRLDYSDGACPSLLLEDTATNLVLTSDSGNYGSAPASETLTISPDGTNNAVIPTPNTDFDRYQQDISGGTYATNTLLTYSWYRKRISTPVITSFVGDLKSVSNVNLTISEATTQIESDINGFDRFQVVVQITDGALASTFRAYFGDIVGVGNSSVAYFGHQYEVGSYATSLINTIGISLTRVADTATDSGNSTVINSSEGTLYFEASVTQSGTVQLYGNASARIWVELNDLDTKLYINNGAGAVVLASSTIASGFNSYRKIAISYKENIFKIFVNGTGLTVTPTQDTFVDSTLNEVTFSFGSPLYGKAKSLQVYTTALSDAELTTLTTI